MKCKYCNCVGHSSNPYDPSYFCFMNPKREYTHVVVYNSEATNALNDVALQDFANKYATSGGIVETGQFDFFNVVRLHVAMGTIDHKKIIFVGFDDNRYITLNKYGNLDTPATQDLFYEKDLSTPIVERLLMQQSKVYKQYKEERLKQANNG